ncbi:MAG: Asp-tRNA(Asn)/Glu-tRNA(Gln) amidotransferase subunit GatC [Armatimonadetes bacterium]|nr:Asp-tRNA(Asn)/Glu-tRNA(Gln) amidotransferase subunit GatC [Armatimonadota bacterium]
MSISLDEVRHVARLARLELDDVELAAFHGELNALLGHFQDVQNVDLSAFGAKPHAVSLQNVWSEDEAVTGLSRDEAMRNASVSRAGLFIVPTIIED